MKTLNNSASSGLRDKIFSLLLFSFKDLNKSSFTSLKLEDEVKFINLFSYSFINETKVNLKSQ